MSRSESFASGLISATGTPEARLMSSVTLSSTFTVRTFLREVAGQPRMQLCGHLFIDIAPLRSRCGHLLWGHADNQLLVSADFSDVRLLVLTFPLRCSSYIHEPL